MVRQPVSIIDKVKRLKAKVVEKLPEWEEIERPEIPHRDPMPPLELWFIKSKRAILGFAEKKFDKVLDMFITKFTFFLIVAALGIGVVLYVVIRGV